MAALSLLRLHVTPESSNGILTVSAIGIAVRLTDTRIARFRLCAGQETAEADACL